MYDLFQIQSKFKPTQIDDRYTYTINSYTQNKKKKQKISLVRSNHRMQIITKSVM